MCCKFKVIMYPPSVGEHPPLAALSQQLFFGVPSTRKRPFSGTTRKHAT